ncbi:MAG: hypothetical protein JSV96_17790, partial [Candidatus Aminicenantes bacterium]
MKNSKNILIVLLFILFLIPCYAAQEEKAAPENLRAIELKDILAWKSIRYSVLSNDGQWFAYMFSPNEG